MKRSNLHHPRYVKAADILAIALIMAIAVYVGVYFSGYENCC